MRLLISCLCWVIWFPIIGASTGPDDPKSTEDLIETMQNRYRDQWFDDFTFVQQTIRFKKDGTSDTAVWYEAIQYPNLFRIDFDLPEKGDAVIYRQDSSYRFREGRLEGSKYDPQAFLLMKGGLYHYPIATVVQKLQSYGYATDKFRRDSLDGVPVYVIGALAGDMRSPQLWLDAKDFYLRRRISTVSKDRVLDVRYSDHIQSNGGWVEQIVQFYLDDRYIQIEYYQQIDTEVELPTAVFDPSLFGKTHWYQPD
ncbi:MAG: hypothetical protein AAFP19_13290 [Bacteroidota bacterium]